MESYSHILDMDDHVDKRRRVESNDEFDFDNFDFDADLSFLEGYSGHCGREVHAEGDFVCRDHSGDSVCCTANGTGCSFSTISEVGSLGNVRLQVGSPEGVSGVVEGFGDGEDFSLGSRGDELLLQANVDGAVQVNVDDCFAELGDDVPNTGAGNFRLQGICFHFTYRSHIRPESIFALFGGKHKFKWYSIVHEVGHAGTDYEHTHVYVRFHSKICYRGPRCCDIDGIHPHIKRVETKVHEGRLFHLYHRGIKGKETIPPVGIWQSEEGPPDPSLSTNRDRMAEMLHRGSLLDAAVGFGIEIRTIGDLKALREERVPAPPAESNYQRDDFNLRIVWSHSFRGQVFDTCSVLLWGGAGLGKTECAISHFERPLLVRSLDQARDYHEARYDGIVFDDVSLVHLSAEERIHLVDYTQPSVIKARYSNGYIGKGVKRIFTTNKTPEEFFRIGTQMTDEQFEAIKRRVKFIHVITPTF